MNATAIVLQAVASVSMAAPIPLDPSMTLAAPTSAARALSVETLKTLPATPETYQLQCLVGQRGQLWECAEFIMGIGPRDLTVFRQQQRATQQRAKASPILAAALYRTRFYRVRLSPALSQTGASVIITEVVAASDLHQGGPSRGLLAKGLLKIEPNPSVPVSDFYPNPALRTFAQARVSASCLVLEDRSLYCRNARVVELPPLSGEPPRWRQPEHDALFEEATIAMLTSMRAQSKTEDGKDSAGYETPISIIFTLPEV